MRKWMLGIVLVSVASAQPAPHILAKNALWKITTLQEGQVTVEPLTDEPYMAYKATFTNPHYIVWGDINRRIWTAKKAWFSPTNRYAVIHWSGYFLKYENIEMQIIDLKDYSFQMLPYSDLANAWDTSPLWTKDEKYIVASGGNTLRLWYIDEDIQVKLLKRPAIKNEWIGDITDFAFIENDKAIQVKYELIKKDTYLDEERELIAVYSMPQGKLLSAVIVKVKRN